MVGGVPRDPRSLPKSTSKNSSQTHRKKHENYRKSIPKGTLWATKRRQKIDLVMTFSTWPLQGSPGNAQGRQMTPQGYQNDTKMSPKLYQNHVKMIPSTTTQKNKKHEKVSSKHHSVSQSASQSASQSGSLSVSQPVNQSVSQSASQPVSQSASQSVSQPASPHTHQPITLSGHGGGKAEGKWITPWTFPRSINMLLVWWTCPWIY